MKVCGIKLTHDGAVALIEDGRLVFSIEMEKLNNNPRFTGIEDTELVSQVLREEGYNLDEIDYFAIDGWGGYDQDALAIQPRLDIGENNNRIHVEYNKEPYKLDVSAYHERTLQDKLLECQEFAGLKMEGKEYGYESYMHLAGHLMGAYHTSPFANKLENSYVLIWDGGTFPRLYFYDAKKNQVENLGPLFLLIGNIYSIFAQHFEPFKVSDVFAKDSLSVAGKVMAYIALGENKKELYPLFDEIYNQHYQAPMGFANKFAQEFKKAIKEKDYRDEDILATFHFYMEELLIKKLSQKIKRFPRDTQNLCIAGGCGLNIKWNSAIRDAPIVKNVYVPPFPNDSGSAIGIAICSYHRHTGKLIDWNVYCGPNVKKSNALEGWSSKGCSVRELSELLYKEKEAVVVLHDRAEVGPRALGNRSIIASPDLPEMKKTLNEIKKREYYRPVSPICLEHRACEIFEPGTKDPYMLFDHRVREEWLNKIPAVIHLDTTARLQTVNEEQNPMIAELLTHFEMLSGIPLLCNTSANYNSKGFFPDAKSAMEWGGTRYVWSEGILYIKEGEKDER